AYIHFECAAKQFKNISDNYQYAPSFELRPETNQALCQAMLAQAYECLYIRCISQGLRSSIIAKVSNQVSRAYEVLIGLLDQLDAPLIPLGWTLVAKTKNKYYLALAQLKLAETIQTKGQHGEAVTRLSLAMKHIDQAKKDAKGFTVGIFSTEDPSESLCPSNTQDFIEACESLAATIKSSYENAKHENEIVYHMDEPRIEDLEPIPHPGDKLGSIKPEEMIKLYDRDDRDVPDFLSKNLFRTLIPLDIHEQSSLYSEEKAKLLRTEVERTAYAEDELNQTLSFMRYPGCIRKFEYSLQRPGSADPANPTVRTPPLRERIIAELSEPSVELAQEAQRVQEAEQQDSLASQLERVDQVRSRATLELNKVGELLNQEQLESNRLLTAYADVIGFSLSPSSSVNVEYRNSFKLYRQNLDAAAESDKALRHRYNTLVESYIDALRQGREGVRAALSYHITSGLEKSDTGQLGVGGVNTESLLDVGEDQPVGLGGYVDAVKATYQRLAQIQQERQA
ncbi:bck1-like resistance to osmotic shock, partial [Spiromyces aspiralis]